MDLPSNQEQWESLSKDIISIPLTRISGICGFKLKKRIRGMVLPCWSRFRIEGCAIDLFSNGIQQYRFCGQEGGVEMIEEVFVGHFQCDIHDDFWMSATQRCFGEETMIGWWRRRSISTSWGIRKGERCRENRKPNEWILSILSFLLSKLVLLL